MMGLLYKVLTIGIFLIDFLVLGPVIITCILFFPFRKILLVSYTIK